MPIRKLTPEEEAAKELEDKGVIDYIKEGKTVEEARALVKENRKPKPTAKKPKKSKKSK